MDRNQLASAIERIEARVRSGVRPTHESLTQTLRTLDALQDDPSSSRGLATAARYTQHWLSQYVAALLDDPHGTRQPEREASLRRLTLETCEALRFVLASAHPDEDVEPFAARRDEPEESAREGRTVLVVEDDQEVRRLAVRALERAGWGVLATGWPEEAISMAGEVESLDALLIDIVLPGMSGIATATRIRRRRPAIPILFMSGYAVEAVAGAADFVAKPFTPVELVAALDSAFERQLEPR